MIFSHVLYQLSYLARKKTVRTESGADGGWLRVTVACQGPLPLAPVCGLHV